MQQRLHRWTRSSRRTLGARTRSRKKIISCRVFSDAGCQSRRADMHMQEIQRASPFLAWSLCMSPLHVGLSQSTALSVPGDLLRLLYQMMSVFLSLRSYKSRLWKIGYTGTGRRSALQRELGVAWERCNMTFCCNAQKKVVVDLPFLRRTLVTPEQLLPLSRQKGGDSEAAISPFLAVEKFAFAVMPSAGPGEVTFHHTGAPKARKWPRMYTFALWTVQFYSISAPNDQKQALRDVIYGFIAIVMAVHEAGDVGSIGSTM